MKNVYRHICFGAVAAALLGSMGCSKRVMVPPRLDLGSYGAIGMIEFASNSEGNLDEFASQKFMEMVQGSQPSLRILELGNEEDVLQTVQRDRMDHRTIRAIGEEYGVDAVVVGAMEVTDVKPKFQMYSLFSINVSADVEATLTARLFETQSGATLWTQSARAKESVAHVGFTKGGPVRFGADDPESAYGKLVGGLVYAITTDFRVSYVRR